MRVNVVLLGTLSCTPYCNYPVTITMPRIHGRKQLAIKAFGDALETLPRWLAFNSGMDPIDVIAQLRSDHAKGLDHMGVGQNECADMYDENVVELASISKTMIWRISEVTSLLLKIDDYFYVKELPIVHKQ